MLLADIKSGAPPSDIPSKVYNRLQLAAGYRRLCIWLEDHIVENAGLIPGLEFFPEEHIYTFASKEVPSVTRLLKPIFLNLKWQCSEADMDRGTYIHNACNAFDRWLQGGKRIPDRKGMERDYPDSTKQLDAWIQFETNEKLISGADPTLKHEKCLIETPLYSHEYGYAGTIDRIYPDKFPGEFVCWNVFLPRDGKAKKIEYPEKNFRKDFNKFRSYLEIYSYAKNGIE